MRLNNGLEMTNEARAESSSLGLCLARRNCNEIEIPQIGVGTWTLRGETARQNVLNDPEIFPW
jgi:hypothetical protein